MENDGSDTSTVKHVLSNQTSNADWWNALSASIKAEGFGVKYVADSPSANTASFTVTSYLTGASGNNGSTTIFNGTTFVNVGGSSFAGGLDASGSAHGDSITVAGSTIDLANTGVATATRVLTTGSGVTSESMFEDLRSKLATATGYTVVTASSGIPRLFSVTSSVTGSSENPNISEGGNTFTVVNAGTQGSTESGAEVGDSITIDARNFVFVAGTPGSGVEISLTGSSAAIRNALSSSIKQNTDFDTISLVDLGSGYHRFSLTSSVVGTTKNVAFVTNSSGIRDTFLNLTGASGGVNSSGIVDTHRVTIKSVTFHLTASTSETDTGSNKFIQTTGSSTQIWRSLKDKIEGGGLGLTVATSSASEIAVFSLTSSVTGSDENASISNVGSSFTSVNSLVGGSNETGISDDDRITFASKTFVLTASAPSDTSNTFHIETTGSSTQIWAALESKIEANTPYSVVTASGPSSAVFQLTASATGSASNSSVTESPSNSRSFSNINALAGGVTFVAAIVGPDNVIMRPRTDLTGSERNINSRFSAPGGPEIQTHGYLDAYTSTFSVHNALPFRNLSVLGSGSGESGTIRVEDHLGLRRGLKALRGLHMGQFGIDSQYGAVTATAYPSSGSFSKQQRNRLRRYEYGPEVDFGSATQASGSFTVSNDTHAGTVQSFAGGRFAIISADSTAKTFVFKNDGTSTGDLDGSQVIVQTNGKTYDNIGTELVNAIQHSNGLQGKVTATFVSSSGVGVTVTVVEADRIGAASNGGSISNTSSGNKFTVNAPGSGQPFNNGAAFVSNIQQTLITGSNHDNMHINSPIPRSEFQYSWIRAAVSGSNWEDKQRILGYAPRDGIVSSSVGYVEAIVFPTASTIFSI